MTAHAHIEPPAQLLAGAFAAHVAAWAQDRGAHGDTLSLLQRVARETCMATAEGHVCLPLNELGAPFKDTDTEELRRILLASGVVGTCAEPGNLPLIIDEEGRVYLHRYFDYERRLAQCLMAASTDSRTTGADAADMLAGMFGSLPADGETDWQRIAAALALTRRLTVISGGPGTGKTTTVANLLACLLHQDRSTRIALAAPTGKAAARMMAAMRSRASALPPHLRALLPKEAFTIHRLLGVQSSGEFRHHARNPLPWDVLVVDEASMLDIALAARLFDAVPPQARVVLLGDKDQLAAVEAGAVFSELSADPTLTPACIDALAALCGMPAGSIACPAPVRPSALADSVIWLTRSYRFSPDSGIGRLAAEVNAGSADSVIAWLPSAREEGASWIREAAARPGETTIDCMQQGYAEYLASLKAGVGMADVFAAFDRFRVLCAVREGPRGVSEINRAISGHIRRELADKDRDPRSDWYLGRPVMVLRNDYTMKLFNGDIGIAWPDGSGKLAAWFPDEHDGFRAVPLARLPEHETAFAMTVHKSQGSEFDNVLLILPAQSSHVLTRELVYTGITRARKAMTLAAGEDMLKAAIETSTRRQSGLISRLREAKQALDNVKV